MAGDETAFIAGQKKRPMGDVERLAQTPQRRLMGPDFSDIVIFKTLRRHAGINRPGLNIIHRDGVAAQFQRQIAGHASNSGFRGAIGGQAGIGFFGHHRGDIDNPPMA